MADEPTGTDNSSAKEKQPGGDGGFTKFASAAGAIVGVLVGINALTGINPLKEILSGDSSPASTPPATSTTTAPTPWTPTPLPPPVTPLLPPVPTSEPSPPYFVVEAKQFDRPCNGGCSMTAIFRNTGGDGSATATFDVFAKGGGYLVSCSVVLPYTAEGEATSAGCNAYNGALRDYFMSTYDGRVRFSVTVNNP